MADRIRVGIVGATVTPGGSGWGANAHIPALRALPGAQMDDISSADAVIVVGGDPCTQQPVAELRVRKARRRGARVSVIGPRPSALDQSCEALRTVPERWEPADTLAWQTMMAWDLSANWSREVLRMRLAQIYPPELLAETLHVAGRCDFSLDCLRYEYPEELVPAGHTAASYLRALTEAGHEVILMDNRGHGASEKLYDPALYGAATMAEDAANLLTHLGIPVADVMGYSMGARITAFLALNHREYVRSAILGGLGHHLVDGIGLPMGIADAMEAPSLKATELKRRIWFTLGALIVFRLLSYVPLPGIDPTALGLLSQRTTGGVLDFFNNFTGGALNRMSIVSRKYLRHT